MVNVSEGPAQSIPPWLRTGVTVIEAVTGEPPEFVTLNEDIFPVPLARSPIEGLLFVHENDAPGVPEKVIDAEAAPLHNVWSPGSATVGVGIISILNVIGVPLQLLALGVIVIMPLPATVVNEGIEVTPV